MQTKLKILFNFILISLVITLVVLQTKTYHKLGKFMSNYQAELEINDKKEKLVELLKEYVAFDENGLIKLIRHGRANDGGYLTPEKALKSSDVLLGYGIADDNSYEVQFSNIYNKPSYGFDCSISNSPSKNPLFTFIQECIANNKFVYNGQKFSDKLSTFSQQLEKLNLKGQKIFIKMDIEGAEYDAFEDILKYAPNVTGIVLEIHFPKNTKIDQAIKLLSSLKKNFILLHVHANNCIEERFAFSSKNSVGRIPQVLELTYINKSLVTNSQVVADQSHPRDIDMPNCPHKHDFEFEILSD